MQAILNLYIHAKIHYLFWPDAMQPKPEHRTVELQNNLNHWLTIDKVSLWLNSKKVANFSLYHLKSRALQGHQLVFI